LRKWKLVFRNRLLYGILIPVIGIGILFSILLSHFLVPPLISLLKHRTDETLKHASDLGIAVCEERFADLLDLRMENNPEMNAASKKEALEQIKSISQINPGIQMLIISKDSKIMAATFDIPSERLHLPKGFKGKTGITSHDLWGEPMKVHLRYFPFWRWHIISLISYKDYIAPVMMAKWIVVLGTFGVLIIVLLAVLLLFVWRVDRPLKQIIDATEEVGKGRLKQVNVRRKDEIAQVALAFNAMVQGLAKDKQQIRSIMAELRQSEDQYRVLTEYSLAHIAMVQKGQYIYANKIMLETLGYSYEDFMGAEFREPVDPKDREWAKGKIAALENGVSKMARFECRYQTKKGETLWLETLATLILYQEKNAVLLHSIDITERKREQLERLELEGKLARAQKMEAIGTLAGGVAHDLNNILGGLVSYPELLLLQLPEDSPLRKSILTIQKSGEKAAAVVQDLLTLARRGVVVTEVVNLNDVIAEYLKSLEYENLQSHHPGVHIETRLEKDVLNILGSPTHLSKTVMNLLSNAAEAMPEGGRLTVSTENRYIDRPIRGYDNVKEGDYMVLTVSDAGTGISPDDIDKIFEPFYTKKKMGRSGTGLGMAVVWGTVKDHNGYIDVQSIEGKGTTFTLYFPVTREKLPEDKSSLSIEAYRGNGESILVIDDVEEQRNIASGMLKELGYSVVSVSSGEEAVEYLKANKIDLLVLDMIMDPGMDGLDTYKKILKMHPEQKAIIASGFSETDRAKEVQSLGAGNYIRKPFLLEKIGLAVKEELEK
jgi:PAS domain S-box-containing protein